MTHAFDFYLKQFARTLVDFGIEYRNAVSLSECAESFFNGFECKTKEMYWRYVSSRDSFDSFDPQLARSYAFAKKWRFALWALEQQQDSVDELRKVFIAKVTEILQKRDLR